MSRGKSAHTHTHEHKRCHSWTVDLYNCIVKSVTLIVTISLCRELPHLILELQYFGIFPDIMH